MGMMTELEALQKKVCCFCEKSVAGKLTRLDQENYRRTALCAECWLDSIRKEPKKYDRTPVQVPLPITGNMPAIVKLPPLSFGQVVLYRSDLLIDCMIRVEQRTDIGYCTFTVIAPSDDVSNRIAKYLGGKDA